MGEKQVKIESSKKRELGQILRFALVGISNFLVDFIIYNLLLRFSPSTSAVLAGVISGTAAMINSFVFNKSFTFRAKKLSPGKIVLFFVITAAGLYLIRPAIIYFFTQVWLWPSQAVYDITSWLGLPFSEEFDKRNLALLIAIAIVLVYNYLSYKFLIFDDEKRKK